MRELKDLGWHRSVAHGRSVDAAGEATPWWTYAATRWLEVVLARHPHCHAFEFGCGASTTWLSRRTAALISVEHDPRWHERVRRTVGANVDLRLIATAETTSTAEVHAAYIDPVSEGRFELVIVDGLHRNACVRAAIGSLTDEGLVVLDDSDRIAYAGAHHALAAAGFGRVDFFGPRPGVGHFSTTSVFCRAFDGWARDLATPDASGY
jgi:hypothetical protein